MAVTTMVFYGRLKNAVEDIFSKDNVILSLSRWGPVERDFDSAESAMGTYTCYFTSPSKNVVTHPFHFVFSIRNN